MRGCHFTLNIVPTIFIMGVSATWDQVRQPVGYEMCKYHCGQFTEWTFCIFLIQRLTCIATWAKYPPQTNRTEAVYLHVTKERQGTISERKTLCEDRPSKIVLTRSNDIRCKNLRTEEKTRLLAAPWISRRKTALHEVNLLNNATTTYHHIKLHSVTAIAYVATLRHVLVASYRTLYAFSLHTNFRVTVKRNVVTSSIAVDDFQQLVFLVIAGPFKCVTSMSPDGRYFQNVTCRDIPRLLCLDIRREILYVVGAKYISSYTYTGQMRHTITSARYVECLTLGEKGDVVYYIDKYNIVQRELYGTGRKVKRLNFQAKCILFNKDYFYMSPKRSTDIQVWHDGKFSKLTGAGVTRQLIALAP